MRAVLLGRVSVQKFLELLGYGGSGKSTLITLITALVGAQNTEPTKLSLLETSRFEAAKLAGKRLIVITDAERYGGEVTTLKAITGQDRIPWEEKNNKRLRHFVAEGLVIISANQAIQSADYTSGLERRRLTIRFDKRPGNPRELIEISESGIPHGEFAKYLPGLVSWVLGMSETDMVRLLGRDGQATPSLARIKAHTTVETNPLAMWANDKLIYDPEEDTRIGNAVRHELTGRYENTATWLYPSYCEYMEVTNHKAMSLTRFPGALDDLCKSQLKLEGVYRHRNSNGSHFRGIRIRRVDIDANIAPFVYAAMTSGWQKVMGHEDTMRTQAIESVDHEDYEGFTQDPIARAHVHARTHAHIEKVLPEKSSQSSFSSISTGYGDSSPHQVLTPLTPSPQADTPKLPIGNATACPKCRSTHIDWGLQAGICQQCRFVIED
jgi:phage/plasmid-associated DNA primase